LLPAAAAVRSVQAVADRADLVFLTVPDGAIAAVAAAARWRAGQGVVHTSGAESLDVLAAPRAAGAAVGGLHPLQTFAATVDPPLAPFAGITCVVEADGPLLARLQAIVRSLGARLVTLPEGSKALYHAAAVFASNYVVAVLHAATELWSVLGISEHEAVEALLPLTRTAVHNVGLHGPAGALTGPVARGDARTLATHLAALRRARPELVPLYRELGLATLRLATEAGTLSAANAAAIAAVLRDEHCGRT
jgi:predicted short-subunit dehydrogenase-like oxidoreductase (DUF2520 family)